MGRGGLMGEILALLLHHGLEDDAKRLEAAGRDPGIVLDVLLSAYRKTCDAAIFSLFVTMTRPLMVSRAGRILKRDDLEHDQEKAISSAYAFILKKALAPRSFAPVCIWKDALGVLELELVRGGRGAASQRQAFMGDQESRFREMT